MDGAEFPKAAVDAAVETSDLYGADHGPAAAMSRRTTTGDLLSWRIASTVPLPYDGLAPFLIIDALRNGLRNKGVRQVELSWILEDNRAMRHVIESLGAHAYKTYRVYEKTLGL